ncbi:hypothetical protein PNK_0542 [Candidatus Protochlamydia naegleriophila]|uniref:Uncharacterized protein n=1 Tax=Candidatus Protochlamydia naegleriophila TaxID=389348 RepID=A0A0U5JBH4_9BACT|nr:hypothetical protein PNK_0542 [Candidatus Protochlamydia naegleriophila]
MKSIELSPLTLLDGAKLITVIYKVPDKWVLTPPKE